MKHVNKKFGLKWTKIPVVLDGIRKITYTELQQEDLLGRFYYPLTKGYTNVTWFAYIENPESAAYLMMKYM
jgi:hypothetical protein